MRKNWMAALPALLLAMTAAAAPPADPSVSQIQEAVKRGDLKQAQEMVDKVLKDHPDSSKAHYVAAEVAARSNNFGIARQQLARAEQLKPGLPYASAHSVSELRSQLARAEKLSAPGRSSSRSHSASQSSGH